MMMFTQGGEDGLSHPKEEWVEVDDQARTAQDVVDHVEEESAGETSDEEEVDEDATASLPLDHQMPVFDDENRSKSGVLEQDITTTGACLDGSFGPLHLGSDESEDEHPNSEEEKKIHGSTDLLNEDDELFGTEDGEEYDEEVDENKDEPSIDLGEENQEKPIDYQEDEIVSTSFDSKSFLRMFQALAFVLGAVVFTLWRKDSEEILLGESFRLVVALDFALLSVFWFSARKFFLSAIFVGVMQMALLIMLSSTYESKVSEMEHAVSNHALESQRRIEKMQDDLVTLLKERDALKTQLNEIKIELESSLEAVAQLETSVQNTENSRTSDRENLNSIRVERQALREFLTEALHRCGWWCDDTRIQMRAKYNWQFKQDPDHPKIIFSSN